MSFSRFPSFQSWLTLAFLAFLVGCQPAPPKTGSTPVTPSTGPATPAASATPATSASPGQTPQGEVTTPQAQAEPVDVIIVGGGLSGLSTAYYLKKAGITFRVLELAPRVGGRARTGNYPDNTGAEVGLAEFWTGNPAIDIANELKVELEMVPPGMSSFIVDGKLYPFVEPYESNQDFIKATLGKDYPEYQVWDKKMVELIHQIEAGHISPELMKLKDVPFDDWLAKEKISPMARKMVKAVIEPEIGTTINKISALDGIAEWHLFAGEGAKPQHCVGGNEKLPNAIADHIGRENISVNTQVTNVIDTADGVEVRALDTTDFDTKIFKAKYCVLTVPLFRLFEIQFTPRLSDNIYKAIHTQSWGAYFTAHVLLDKEAEKFWSVEGTGSVLPILSGGPLGCIYAGHENPGQPEDAVMLNLLVTGNAAEQFNARTMSLDDVQKSLEAAMARTWPGSEKMIRRWTFYRYHPRAIASWPVGRSRFDELSEGLRKAHGHLYFGGDFTESSHSDGALRSAQRMSTQIKQIMGK